MQSITIKLPLPHAGLTPNGQDTSGRRFKLIRAAREIGFFCAFAALNRRDSPRWKEATVDVARFGKVRRDCDRDNCIASLKHQIDGIVDAGILENDKYLQWGDVRFDVDASDPRIELTIRPKGAK